MFSALNEQCKNEEKKKTTGKGAYAKRMPVKKAARTKKTRQNSVLDGHSLEAIMSFITQTDPGTWTYTKNTSSALIDRMVSMQLGTKEHLEPVRHLLLEAEQDAVKAYKDTVSKRIAAIIQTRFGK